MKVWKWIGLAGIFGIAGGGVAIARQERVRRAYTPDQVRSRLHQRLAEATERAAASALTEAAAPPSRQSLPARHSRGEEAATTALTNGTDHLPDVHHDAELEWAEESTPGVQAEHGPGLAPMMDLE